MDKERPHGDMGMVRDGLDVGLEKHVSTYRNEQELGLSPTEGRCMVTNSKPMVEVPHRPSYSPVASDEQLRAIKTNIRKAAFRKISDRSENKVDTTNDSCEENFT